ncbi:uncharacterized protein V1516DRAFT_693298 [Lipomyces oligophaga]|uniref:uncharacterized protein n=1 Tax=Lipomyces oligophaga TaxID=45792 RepID=UPI0034CD292E
MKTIDPRKHHIGAAQWVAVTRWARLYTCQNVGLFADSDLAIDEDQRYIWQFTISKRDVPTGNGRAISKSMVGIHDDVSEVGEAK